MAKNNLFDFATSELSQDAFICWSINNLNQVDDEEAKSYGAAFVNFLIGTDLGTDIKIEKKGLIKQYHIPKSGSRNHVDVVAKLECNGEKYLIVMENKTHTTHSKNQLQTYHKYFDNEEVFSKYQKHYIYFKTGLPTDHDKNVSELHFKLITRENFCTFLQNQTWDNPILKEYTQYITAWNDNWQANNTNLLKGNDLKKLNHAYCQWALVEEIRQLKPVQYKGRCYNGTSSGRPWTQYCFWMIDELYPTGKINLDTGKEILREDALFYRIDRRKNENGYYIALRHYAGVSKDCKETKAIKRRRAEKCKEIWNNSGIEDITVLVFGKPSSGTAEDEIFTIFFNESQNTISSVIEKLPDVHNRFIKLLEDNGFFDKDKVRAEITKQWESCD